MIGNYYDDETMVIAKGLPYLHPSDQVEAANYAKERKSAFLSGRAMAPDFWQRALQAYDPTLAMRFDFDHNCFLIERWVESETCWYPILFWRDENNIPHRLSEVMIPFALGILERNNLQARYGSDREYLAHKRAKAMANQRRHADARTESVLEAVDGLSKKQIQNFIDVHRAMHTGERIVAHGQDEKWLEMAARNRSMIPQGKSINPGMHPLLYKRQPR